MKRINLICLLPIVFLAAACSDKSTEKVQFNPEEPGIIRVPDDTTSILAALEMAGWNDTIIVSDGIYKDSGNRDIDFPDKTVVLKSENGPAGAIIDCGGDISEPHRAFRFDNINKNVTIDGFKIRGGYSNHGGAIYCMNSSPHIINCVFTDNQANVSGAHVWCKSSSPVFENCTFVRGSADAGGAFFISANSSPVVSNCILAYADLGQAIATLATSEIPILNCCLIYGNEGGDWVGDIAGQLNINGNLSMAPLFCEFDSGDYTLSSVSPCLPENNSCGLLIGALGVGCD